MGSNDKTPVKESKISAFKKFGLGTSIVLVLSIIIYLIFMPRLSPRSQKLPIPYIFGNNFKKALLTYLNLETHGQVLAIAGNDDLEKTRGILEFVSIVNNSGRIPIVFNFFEMTGKETNREISEFLLKSVLDGFRMVDSHLKINYTELTEEAYFLKNININNDNRIQLKDVSLIKMYLYLKELLKDSNQSIFNKFFEILDLYSKVVKIMIISFEPVSFKPFIKFCNGYSLNLQNVGIIREISNIFDNDEILSNPNVYRVIYPDEFDRESGRNVLVKQERVFKQKLFTKLYDLFGGYGKFYTEYHDLINEGLSIEEAINAVQEHLTTNIKKATIDGLDDKEIIKRRRFLKQLYYKGKIKINDVNLQIVKHYNKWGLFSTLKENKITIPNNIYKNAIYSVFKSF